MTCDNETIEKYRALLREKLSDKRYRHSLAVADEAVRLSHIYGCDVEKAHIAGLLHDVMKDSKDADMLQTLNQFGIMLSDVEKREKKLWHAIAGAGYVKNILGIADNDIINAIRYHTTARANMSLIEKVIYLADFTSADRDYPGVDRMRRAVDLSMPEAMKEALQFTIMDLAEQLNAIHPDTIAAYNQMVLENL